MEKPTQKHKQLSGLGKIILGTILTTSMLVQIVLLPDLIKSYSNSNENNRNGVNNNYIDSERLLALRYK